MHRTLLTAALSLVLAAPAVAQQLKVSFHEGRVTVDAAGVPVRQILSEWAKQGDTKVIGTERITGAPLTLTLVDVPEAQALEVILRSVAGYMAAPRSSGTGGSMYDRILIMATSVPVPAATATPRPQPNPAMNGAQRFVPPRVQPAEEEEEDEEEDPNPPNPPVFTFPQQPGAVPPGFNNQQNFNGPPMIVNPQVMPPGAGNAVPPVSYPTPNVTVPVGSSTPGMINVPPPPPGQVRPPGGQRQQ